MRAVENVLLEVPFFSDVPRDVLARVAGDSFQKRYRSGDRIVVQGEYGHTMFVLLEGGLRVMLGVDDGSQREIARLDRPGQFFGELSVISQARRTATVIAESDALLLEIEKQRIEKLSQEHGSVLSSLEAFYQRRIVTTYLAQCGHFTGIEPAMFDRAVRESTMRMLGRDDHVYEIGAPNDALYLVKDGHLKMHRPGAGARTNVLGYFNAGDFFGVPDEGDKRQATVTALGKVEVIRIPSDVATSLLTSPVIKERLNKVTFVRKEAMLKVLGGGQTVAFAAQQLMLDGQVDAASLLIIDLETCVRCGNCSASCHDRHGASRLARRGKKLRRRVGGFAEGRHQHVLIPSSCYHCSNPECMVGCPTGAIHREKDGEVNIHDFCIGCTNCARRCPYDNITMAERGDAGVLDAAGKKKSKQIATKCDLCATYADAACVTNCPTGAVLRVDPKIYFEEVAALREGAAESQNAKVRSTVRAQGYRRSFWPVAAGATIFALALLALYLGGARPRRAASGAGVALGIIAALSCLGATLLAARRRLRKLKLGTLQRWTQVHIALGAVGFFAALLHSSFALHGVVAGALLVVFGGIFLSGCAGQLLYTLVPPILARIEGEQSLLVEDVHRELGALVAELDALVDGGDMQALARAARRRVGGWRVRFGRHYAPAEYVADAHSDERLSDLIAELPAERRGDGRRVVADVARRTDLRLSLHLYRLLRVWLALHIAATGALWLLLFAHIGAVLWFR